MVGTQVVRPLRGLTSVSLPFLLSYLSDERLGAVGVDRGHRRTFGARTPDGDGHVPGHDPDIPCRVERPKGS